MKITGRNEDTLKKIYHHVVGEIVTPEMQNAYDWMEALQASEQGQRRRRHPDQNCGDSVTAIGRRGRTADLAEPGPLIAMTLQAVLNRSATKQGTDILDVVRLALDQVTGPDALAQIGGVAQPVASDIAGHVDLWLVRRREQALRWVRAAGGVDVAVDDLDLVAELLLAACTQPVPDGRPRTSPRPRPRRQGRPAPRL